MEKKTVITLSDKEQWMIESIKENLEAIESLKIDIDVRLQALRNAGISLRILEEMTGICYGTIHRHTQTPDNRIPIT